MRGWKVVFGVRSHRGGFQTMNDENDPRSQLRVAGETYLWVSVI